MDSGLSITKRGFQASEYERIPGSLQSPLGGLWLKKALKGMAREIGKDLINEMAARSVVENPPAEDTAQLLLQHLAHQVAAQLQADAARVTSLEKLEARIGRLETSLQKLAPHDVGDDDDEDEALGASSRFPNLKYAKPKYKDVESVLKYIESDDENGGVKLVIMNFND